MQLSLYRPSSPMTLVASWLTSPQTFNGNIGSGGTEWQRGMKNTQFSASNSPFLRKGTKTTRYYQSYYWWLIGSRMFAFDWYQNRWPWMTLNCYMFKFSRNFALLRMFERKQRLKDDHTIPMIPCSFNNSWQNARNTVIVHDHTISGKNVAQWL